MKIRFWTRHFTLGDKTVLTIIRWLNIVVILAFVYYLVPEKTPVSVVRQLAGIMALYVSVNVLFSFLSQKTLDRMAWRLAVFSADVLLVTLSIYLTQGFESELYLSYFLIILIAGLGRDMGSSIVLGLIACLVYMFLLFHFRPEYLQRAEILLRIPFLFLTSLFATYVAHREWSIRRKAEEEKKRLEVQMFHSERLSMVGKLAAGIAHELNNPLTGILGFASLLLREKSLSPEQREGLENIHKRGKRCTEILRSLLRMSRKSDSPAKSLSLGNVLMSALEMDGYGINFAPVEIIKDIPEDLPTVLGDEVQLQQMFLNLISNARHAMKERKDACLRIRAHFEDDKVLVSVEDNGCGIPAENLNKIFDPFFTTKSSDEGTGLGLSISYSIIQQHAGALRAESEVGKGSCFVVELPVHKAS